MFNILLVILSCSPWAAGAGRPARQIDLEHFAQQPTPAVEVLDPELHKLCHGGGARAIQKFKRKLERSLASSFGSFSVLEEVFNCSDTPLRCAVADGPLKMALNKYANETMPLVETLMKDKSTFVREAAWTTVTRGIPKFGHSVAHLLNEALRDGSPRIRQEAAKTLQRSVNDLGTESIPLFELAMRDSDLLVREPGARAFDGILRQHAEEAERLCEVAITDRSEEIRSIFARSALGVAVDKFGVQAFKMFRSLMGDRSTDVRNAAADTLAAKVRNNSAAGIAIFKRAINISCQGYSGQHGWAPTSERGSECPIAATAAGEPLVAALEILGGDALPFLTLALHRLEPDVREKAAGKPLFMTIQPMKFEDARELTMPIVYDDDEKVRAAAGQASAWVEKLEVQRQANKSKSLAAEAQQQARLAEEHARLATDAKAKAEEQARLATEAKAESERQAKLANESNAEAVAQAKVAKEKMQEAEIERFRAESSNEARQELQKALQEKKVALENAERSFMVKELELQAKAQRDRMEENIRIDKMEAQNEKDKAEEEYNRKLDNLKREHEVDLSRSELDASKKAMVEKKEEIITYRNLAIGAVLSAVVAVLPLLANRFVAAPQ